MAAQAHHQSPPMPLHHAVGPPPGAGAPPSQWAPSRQILAMNEAVWCQIGMSTKPQAARTDAVASPVP